VIRIRRALEVLQVAVHAVRIATGQRVVVVDVALGALQRSMRTCEREARCGVIEGRARPRRGVMALSAGLGEAGLHVVRIRGPLEVLQVAADASGVGTRQVVVVIDVTLCAGHCRVGPRQRESRGRVIEGRVCPRNGVVALLTGLREAGLHVIRIRGSLEVLEVATHARRVRVRQVVVVVDVALRALHGRVRTAQGKSSGRVIERRVIPRRSRMTLLAGLREA